MYRVKIKNKRFKKKQMGACSATVQQPLTQQEKSSWEDIASKTLKETCGRKVRASKQSWTPKQE